MGVVSRVSQYARGASVWAEGPKKFDCLRISCVLPTALISGVGTAQRRHLENPLIVSLRFGELSASTI